MRDTPAAVLRLAGGLAVLLFYDWTILAPRGDAAAAADDLRELADQSRTLYRAGRYAAGTGGDPPRDSYMVVSSYGPVYGILRGNGRWLYIADGVNYTDYYFDLAGDPAGATNLVTPAARGDYQPLIVEGIESVNRFYRPLLH